MLTEVLVWQTLVLQEALNLLCCWSQQKALLLIQLEESICNWSLIVLLKWLKASLCKNVICLNSKAWAYSSSCSRARAAIRTQHCEQTRFGLTEVVSWGRKALVRVKWSNTMHSLLLWFNVCLGYSKWEFENRGVKEEDGACLQPTLCASCNLDTG